MKKKRLVVSPAKRAYQEIVPAPASEQLSVEDLIAKAIDKGTPVGTMERLLTMRDKLKAEFAKEEFNKAMAAFQADCPTIKKTKEVKTNTGTVAYSYAPIESIVDQVKSLLQKHGFSYSSTMDLLDDKVKVTIKVTHAAGHSEHNEMTVPLGNKTQVMSATQVVAAAQTFAKRYAFCNAFGILTGDEDNDARPNPVPPAAEKPITVNVTPVLKATGQQIDRIKSLIAIGGYHTLRDFELAAGIKTPIIEMNVNEAQLLIKKLEEKTAGKQTVAAGETEIDMDKLNASLEEDN